MEHTKVPVDRFIPLNLTDEEPSWPNPCRLSLASKLFVSRFGLAPDTAITSLVSSDCRRSTSGEMEPRLKPISLRMARRCEEG